MMYQGFTGDYEAPSSRCSSASPAGDSLTYYPSPADSFSSMGSPVNPQVRGWLPAGGGMQGGGGGRRGPSKAPGSLEARCRRLPAARGPAGGVPVPVGRGVRGYGGSRGRAARGGGCVKRLH